MAHQVLHATSHLWKFGNGVKAPGSGNKIHRTPFSDNMRVLTRGEYGGLTLLDFDRNLGADNGVDVALGGVCERKEIILDALGQSSEDNPQQEALYLYMTRSAQLRFFKERDPAAPPSKTTNAATGIEAIELDVATGQVCNKFRIGSGWDRAVQAQARTRLGGGRGFTANGKAHAYVLATCDNRQLNLPVRNFGVVAFIIEMVGTSPVSKLGNQDLRIYTRFARDLASTQCLQPLVVTASTRTLNGPWTLQVRDEMGRAVNDLLLPLLPQNPGRFLGADRHLNAQEKTEKSAALKQIGLWQRLWNEQLQLTTRYGALRGEAVHRSLKEDGQSYCRACLAGQCTQQLHRTQP